MGFDRSAKKANLYCTNMEATTRTVLIPPPQALRTFTASSFREKLDRSIFQTELKAKELVSLVLSHIKKWIFCNKVFIELVKKILIS